MSVAGGGDGKPAPRFLPPRASLPEWKSLVKSILIIDDDPMFREVVRMRLSAAGYQTFVAGGAEEGWERARAHRPDVVLLDLVMPQADGVTFLRKLRADPTLATTPVIVV